MFVDGLAAGKEQGTKSKMSKGGSYKAEDVVRVRVWVVEIWAGRNVLRQ